MKNITINGTTFGYEDAGQLQELLSALGLAGSAPITFDNSPSVPVVTPSVPATEGDETPPGTRVHATTAKSDEERKKDHGEGVKKSWEEASRLAEELGVTRMEARSILKRQREAHEAELRVIRGEK